MASADEAVMAQRYRKTVFTLLRLALCAAFLTLVVRGVSWHDRVTVASLDGAVGEEVTYRLIGEDEESVTVEGADGLERRIPLHQVGVDDSGAPRIERGMAFAWKNCDAGVLLLAFVVFAPTSLIQSLRFAPLYYPHTGPNL